jgi:hypothetical protein
VTLAAAVALLAAAALPAGRARYRVELGGAHAGVATLTVSCARDGCEARWSSALRAPEAAGGALSRRDVVVETDREGRLAGAVSLERDGEARPAFARPGEVPATVLELVLAAAARDTPIGRVCVPAFDEETGASARACARRDGAALEAELVGARARITPGADGFPERVELPEQGARFVRDPAATVPRAAPRLEVRVPGPPPADARAFCGAPRDRPARDGPPPGSPAATAPGASCREKALAWVERARAAGLDARAAVGVAFDGTGFAWHAWAEVRGRDGWIAVDPTFGEAPARAPRFTLATFAPGDAAQEAEAGRRILACWGRARVE